MRRRRPSRSRERTKASCALSRSPTSARSGRPVLLSRRLHLRLPDRGGRLQHAARGVRGVAGAGARHQRGRRRDAPRLGGGARRRGLPAAQRLRPRGLPRLRGLETGRAARLARHDRRDTRGEDRVPGREPDERRAERRGDAPRAPRARHRAPLPGRLAARPADARSRPALLIVARGSMAVLGAKKEALQRRIRARELVFGIQDGLLSTVGLLSGVSVATQDRRVIVITGVAAGVTGGISMATGSYLAARTERDIFERELRDQERLAASEPYLAQEALLESLTADGLDRPSAYRVVATLSRREDLLLRTVQEKVLGLSAVDLSQPLKAGFVMFVSFVTGALIPVVPFLLPLGRATLPAVWGVSVVTLLGVGVVKGVLTPQPLLRSGVEFAAIALGSAVVGWGIGRLLGGTPGCGR